MTGGAEDDIFKRIPPSRRMLAGFVLALSNFMVVLDLTIANVSIPHIAGSLGITMDQGAWIITSYAVAEAVIVPLTGWLAQRFGTVRVFIVSMAGFGLFSLLCGLSLTLELLVLARIGQGLCGGPIMPMSQTLLLRVFPPEQRASAMTLWAMTVVLGPATGPILGGFISDELSWHWIFFINLPVAVFCILTATVILRPAETETLRLPVDRIGLALLIFWIACLQIMLDLGRDRDWFGDSLIVILAILAAIGFLAFLIWELTERHPIVDLTVLRYRGLSASLVAMILAYGSFFSSVVILPQWLQLSQGYTAGQAGLILGLQSIASLTTAPIVPLIMKRADSRLLLSGALLWMSCTTLLRAYFTTDTDFWTISLAMMLQGLAMPFMMIPLTTVSLGSVAPSETAQAAGLQNFVRTLSTAVVTAAALTIWGDSQRALRNGLVENLDPAIATAPFVASGFNEEQARMMVSQLVDQQALLLAMNHVYQISAVLFVLASLVVWLVPKSEGPLSQPMGH